MTRYQLRVNIKYDFETNENIVSWTGVTSVLSMRMRRHVVGAMSKPDPAQVKAWPETVIQLVVPESI